MRAAEWASGLLGGMDAERDEADLRKVGGGPGGHSGQVGAWHGRRPARGTKPAARSVRSPSCITLPSLGSAQIDRGRPEGSGSSAHGETARSAETAESVHGREEQMKELKEMMREQMEAMEQIKEAMGKLHGSAQIDRGRPREGSGFATVDTAKSAETAESAHGWKEQMKKLKEMMREQMEAMEQIKEAMGKLHGKLWEATRNLLERQEAVSDACEEIFARTTLQLGTLPEADMADDDWDAWLAEAAEKLKEEATGATGGSPPPSTALSKAADERAARGRVHTFWAAARVLEQSGIVMNKATEKAADELSVAAKVTTIAAASGQRQETLEGCWQRERRKIEAAAAAAAAEATDLEIEFDALVDALPSGVGDALTDRVAACSDAARGELMRELMLPSWPRFKATVDAMPSEEVIDPTLGFSAGLLQLAPRRVQRMIYEELRENEARGLLKDAPARRLLYMGTASAGAGSIR